MTIDAPGSSATARSGIATAGAAQQAPRQVQVWFAWCDGAL
jgi:hypothetical protein